MDCNIYILILQLNVIAMLLIKMSLSRQQTNRTRRIWVREIFQRRQELGEFNLVEEMRQDPQSFYKYFRMNEATFDLLLSKVKPFITKCTTNYRKPIPPDVRLAVTLRFLATGDAQQTLSFSFRIGHSTVAGILQETCEVLWKVLVDEYMKMPENYDHWRSIASEFNEQWNYPNCLGALDGKHVTIQAPANSGSEYYNYKGTFSIVLLGLCDANYSFVMIDVGDSGRRSDGGVFTNSRFGQKFINNDLNIPPPTRIKDTQYEVPYTIVGDNAFPLKMNLMRPYPGLNLPQDKAIFNYRLSRARRIIENTFGILTTRWRIFKRPIIATAESAITFTKAACALHNFLQIRSMELTPEERFYCPPSLIDREDSMGNLTNGDWRTDSGELQPVGRISSNYYSRNAALVRDELKKYFNSVEGSVSWQIQVVNR